MFKISIEDCKLLFAHCSNGIVLFNHQGKQVYQNPAFEHFPEQDKPELLAGHCPAQALHRYQLYQHTLTNGSALLIRPILAPEHPQDAVLSSLLEQINNADDVYAATAEALHRTLGWRWVSITRFVGSTVEVLAHWDTDRLSDNFSFEITGTPCELMASTGRYTLFTDVAKAFPENVPLQQIGAQTYAGLIYQGSQQKPVGHIMAMHDQRAVDYQHVEEVITLASLALSANMLLAQANDNLAKALEESRTDGLTQLYNRKHFDEVRTSLAADFNNDSAADACMAVVDMNGFKAYNDNRGHQAGDMLLQLVASELQKIGRQGDLAFRVGGDEFALILPNLQNPQISRLNQQLTDSMRRLSLITNHPIHCSTGYAMLSETAGCTDQWYELADQRMYSNKRRDTTTDKQ